MYVYLTMMYVYYYGRRSVQTNLSTQIYYSDEEATVPSPETPVTPQNDAMDAYKMVLETVWVDGILDPGEVHLLAKRRDELNISFEEHLNLVREMLG